MQISASIPADKAEPMYDRMTVEVKPVDPVKAALSDYKKFKQLMPESISERGYWDGEFMLMLYNAYCNADEPLIGKLMLKLFERYVTQNQGDML